MQEIGAGDADIGGEEFLAQDRRAPRRPASRGSLEARASDRDAVCVARKLSATCSFTRWIAGAMMWLGGSWRSWMMYSPRSVSTGVMPFASRIIVERDLLGDHRLALGHGLGARRGGRSPSTVSRASCGVRHQCTWPPRADDLALERLEIEIEMLQHVVLDRRLPCSRSASNSGSRRSPGAALRGKPARIRPSAFCRLASAERVVRVLLEGVAGGLHQRGSLRSGAPIGGVSSVMPASTSATWRTRDRLAAARQLAGHVEQAAEIAGEQRVGAGARRCRPPCRATMRVGDLRIFDAEGAAEAAADFGARQLAERQPATPASSLRGCCLTPSSRRPEQES